MLRPVEMKRLDALLLEENKEDVLRELKERGVIQFIDLKETPLLQTLDLRPGETSWVKVNASEYISKIDGILEVFSIVQDKKSKSLINELLGAEETEKKKVEDLPSQKLFDQIEEKLYLLEEKVNRISPELERLKREKEEWQNARDVVSKLEKFGIGPKDLKGYREILVTFGTIPTSEIEKLAKDARDITELFIFYTKELSKGNSLMLAIFPRKFEADLWRVLRLHRFEEIHIPINLSHLDLEEAKKKIDSELSFIEKEEKKIWKELKKLADKETENLLLMRESLQIEKFMDESNTLFGRTSRTYLLRGWVPVHLVNKAKEIIEKASKGYSLIWISDPEEGDKPPTLLNNPPQTDGLELITMTYGAPDYHELDPTSVIALTFPLIFGLMFGDVGHGLMLAILGYYLGFKIEAGEGAKKLGKTLILCGIFSMIAGFFYGAVFGLEEVIHPIWKSPLHHISDAIAFALKLGILLLILACILNMGNEIIHKKYADAIVSPYGIAGIWLLIGGASMVMKHGTDIFGILKDQSIYPAVVFPFLLMWLGEWRVTKVSLFWALFETYENLSRYLVNSISFVRIVILAIIHEALSSIMVMVMGLAPPTALGLVVKSITFIIGNIFIFAIEMFVSFIQTLRLHYYEIFSKFYSGEGKIFNPFKAFRRYTYIEPKA
jgi:V/A-type H+-transporting ATPase subunit I